MTGTLAGSGSANKRARVNESFTMANNRSASDAELAGRGAAPAGGEAAAARAAP